MELTKFECAVISFIAGAGVALLTANALIAANLLLLAR